MSTDQPTLSEFTTDRDKPDIQFSDKPENQCLNCGSDIPPQIGRVMGDNNGCVQACDAEECVGTTRGGRQ